MAQRRATPKRGGLGHTRLGVCRPTVAESTPPARPSTVPHIRVQRSRPGLHVVLSTGARIFFELPPRVRGDALRERSSPAAALHVQVRLRGMRNKGKC